jgi:hypothetical protein
LLPDAIQHPLGVERPLRCARDGSADSAMRSAPCRRPAPPCSS